jgi:hypothetical protein
MAVQGNEEDPDCPDCSGGEDDDDEGGGPSAGGGEDGQPSASAPAGGGRKGKKGRKSGSRKRDGGSIGAPARGVCRLLCFCPKHRAAQVPGPRPVPIHASNTGAAAPTPTRAAAAAAAAVGGARRGGAPLPFGLPGDGGAGVKGPAAAVAAAAAGPGGAAAAAVAAAAADDPLLSPGRTTAAAASAAAAAKLSGCARTRPADAALRRGLRAPEALEAALRKRGYVRRLPYLVTGAQPRPARPLLPPPVRGARTAGPEFEADGKGPAWAGAVSGTTAPPAAPVSNSGGGAGRVLSQAERFAAMVASAGDRVAMGKSAIHGWGAFAKVPHRAGGSGGGAGRTGEGRGPMWLLWAQQGVPASPGGCRFTPVIQAPPSSSQPCHAPLNLNPPPSHPPPPTPGDMVIEYVGSLVRPSVADSLERRHYNQVVGAGESRVGRGRGLVTVGVGAGRARARGGLALLWAQGPASPSHTSSPPRPPNCHHPKHTAPPPTTRTPSTPPPQAHTYSG